MFPTECCNNHRSSPPPTSRRIRPPIRPTTSSTSTPTRSWPPRPREASTTSPAAPERTAVVGLSPHPCSSPMPKIFGRTSTMGPSLKSATPVEKAISLIHFPPLARELALSIPTAMSSSSAVTRATRAPSLDSDACTPQMAVPVPTTTSTMSGRAAPQMTSSTQPAISFVMILSWMLAPTHQNPAGMRVPNNGSKDPPWISRVSEEYLIVFPFMIVLSTPVQILIHSSYMVWLFTAGMAEEQFGIFSSHGFWLPFLQQFNF